MVDLCCVTLAGMIMGIILIWLTKDNDYHDPDHCGCNRR